MSRDYIKSNVVQIGLDPQSKTNLYDYVDSSAVIPIDVFYQSSLEQAISAAITYLTDKREGSVYIPADANNHAVYINARVGKDLQVDINYSTVNYRFPINSEARPYSGGNWQIGDIIINNDISDAKCEGWVCIEAGTPGTWQAFGYIRRWFTEVEQLDQLPEPGPMQLSRQVMSGGRVYICKLVDGEYAWYWMDYAYGTTAQRPTTDLRKGLPYYNIQTGLPEWYNGNEWVAVALADHTHASDATDPIYSEFEATNSGREFLPDSAEGFCGIQLYSTNQNGATRAQVNTLANLFDTSKLEAVDSDMSSYEVISSSEVNLVNSTGGEGIVCKLELQLDPYTKYEYSHYQEFESASAKIELQVLGTDGFEETEASSIDLSTSDYRLTTTFTTKRSGKVTISYSFKSDSNINDILYLSEIFIALSSDTYKFSLKDYLDEMGASSLYPFYSVDAAHDELYNNTVIKRVGITRINDPTYAYSILNPDTYLQDGYLQAQIDLSGTMIGESNNIPSSDDTAAVLNLSSEFTSRFEVKAYNVVKAGSNSSAAVGLSTEGVLLYNIPTNLLENSLPSTHIEYITEVPGLAKVVYKEPKITKLAKYPRVLKSNKNGIVQYDLDSGMVLTLNYPANIAATTESTSVVLNRLINQAVILGEAPVAWTNDLSWDKAAQNNTDWSGNTNG